MKLTFKDLKQQKFLIDAEPSDTIAQLKGKITAEKGWDASLQKLIYSGKILQDDKTVASYNIEEKGFVVCMVSKPKAAPAAASSSKATATPAKAPSTPAQPTVPVTPSAPAQSAAASSSSSAVPETPTPAGSGSGSAAPSNFNDPSALAMGGDAELAIQDMIAMGFERSEAERAMRAAFFNPDRAVDYLLNGIPDSVQQERQPQSPAARPAAQAPSAPRSAAPAGGDASAEPSNPENINLFEAAAAAASQRSGLGARGSGSGGLGNLDFLRNNPQFQQLRQVVQQQPQMLEPILQQVGSGNPQLAALISQNPDAFLQLLSEDPDDGEGDAPLPPGAQQIAVTPDERDAIERLCRLGFDRDMVIQAYFACDKNEELAANFLFEQPDDDMEP